MTTKRVYECNLCRATINASNGGRGFKWGHKRLDWAPLYDVENHICDQCVASLIVSLRDPGIVEDFGADTSQQRGKS